MKKVASFRVALACPGVGVEQRGFERMMVNLFDLLKDDMDVTLFKGGGARSSRQRRLFFIKRNGKFLKYFPLHKLIRRTPIHVECLTFSIALLWHVVWHGFDIVHCTDPPLARLLYRFRALFGLKFRLLYTEATAMPPSDYPPADHMHQISKITMQQAAQHGISPDYMSLIPIGFYPESFESNAVSSTVREQYGVPEDVFVILCVSALNRTHKRIDYLIDEFASLDREFLLWIDGSMDQGEADLIDYAKERLGVRCRITHVPSAKLGDLFSIADVFVHAATFEAFGLAPVEAAGLNLPVLCHNSPHFRWLLNDTAGAIDMKQAGNLREKVRACMDNRSLLNRYRHGEWVRETYNWRILKDRYLRLYKHMSELDAANIGVADRYGLQ